MLRTQFLVFPHFIGHCKAATQPTSGNGSKRSGIKYGHVQGQTDTQTDRQTGVSDYYHRVIGGIYLGPLSGVLLEADMLQA